jgi:hypothetical protein
MCTPFFGGTYNLKLLILSHRYVNMEVLRVRHIPTYYKSSTSPCEKVYIGGWSNGDR